MLDRLPGHSEGLERALEWRVRDPLTPLAEFAYNNAPSATTGVSPFFANKGYHPNLSIYPE